MLFSIITPSYRQLKWLSLCAASIADQEGEIEHLVQDAESAGIDLWIRDHPAVRVNVERDSGMYDAINRGMGRAHGDILAYLNCDEQYLPGTLARVGAHFEAHPETDLLLGDALLVDVEGTALSYRRVVRPDRLHTRLCHLGVWSCSMFFRRRLWDRGLRFSPEYRAIGDAVFVEQALALGAQTAILPQPLAAFAILDDNLGASAKADEEARVWRNSWGPAGPWLAPWLRGQHWIEKALAGAYHSRSVDYSIHTLATPNQRQSFHVDQLGWGWPGERRSSFR